MIVAVLPPMVETSVTFLLSICIVMMSFSVTGLARLVRSCFVFWACTSLIGGLLYVVQRFLVESPLDNYVDHPLGMLGILSIVLMGTIVCCSRVVESLQMKHLEETFSYEVEIKVNGQAWHGFGYLDSGNHVTDPFSKSPVIFATLNVANELLPQRVYESLHGNQISNWPVNWQKRVRMIPSRSVHASNKMLIGILCDDVTCSLNGKKYSLKNVPVVFTQESLAFEKNCNCLLHPLQLLPCHQN